MSNREFLTNLLREEKDRFLCVMDAVPSDRLDWRPETKSRTSGELLGHLIGHEQDLIELVETGKINHRMQVPFDDHAHALSLFRAAREQLVEKLAALDDASWASDGEFLVDGKVIYTLPRMKLGWLLFLDAVHHRGQLSTYLRPMGSKCPSIYGPSADTQPK
jgi:uncharacterized damage-inducible protein DinB